MCNHVVVKQPVSPYRSDNYVCKKCGKEFPQAMTFRLFGCTVIVYRAERSPDASRVPMASMVWKETLDGSPSVSDPAGLCRGRRFGLWFRPLYLVAILQRLEISV